MSLDLIEITGEWAGRTEGIRARLITGVDGRELVQLKVDLGLLQMFPDDQPAGPDVPADVLAKLQAESRAGRPIAESLLATLQRELAQFNFRRLALTVVAEEAIQSNDEAAARRSLQRAIRDIEHCMAILDALEVADTSAAQPHRALRPPLVFNHARLGSRLLESEERFAEAAEVADTGAGRLIDVLELFGYDPADCGNDPAVQFLRQNADRLRGMAASEDDPRVGLLRQALAQEDFETAARLRDELRRRARDE